MVISSSSVYQDKSGRTLDEAAATAGFPDLPDPISETQQTVSPGPATDSTRKMAMERTLRDGARVPVTILRPCAIYGRGSSHPRGWWFVKRMLDRRPIIPIAFRGIHVDMAIPASTSGVDGDCDVLDCWGDFHVRHGDNRSLAVTVVRPHLFWFTWRIVSKSAAPNPALRRMSVRKSVLPSM